MIMKTRLSNQSDFRHCLATSLCISDKLALRSIQRLWNQSSLWVKIRDFVVVVVVVVVVAVVVVIVPLSYIDCI